MATSWDTIRKKIGKGLNDPNLVKYGSMAKTAFATAYRAYILEAKPEELEIQRSLQTIHLNNGKGSYKIPLSVAYIGITESSDIRLILETEKDYRRATNNSFLAMQKDEVAYYKDNNTLRFRADNDINSFTIYVQYVPDFDFDEGTSMSEIAISTIIENTINLLAGRYERNTTD